MSFNAQSTILCVDKDPIAGKLCLTEQNKTPDTEEARFNKLIRESVDSYITSNCLEKDGECITDMTIEYCDTDINVCNMYGEIDADTGTFYVYRVIYSIQDSGFLGDNVKIKLDSVTKTSEIGYPN